MDRIAEPSAPATPACFSVCVHRAPLRNKRRLQEGVNVLRGDAAGHAAAAGSVGIRARSVLQSPIPVPPCSLRFHTNAPGGGGSLWHTLRLGQKVGSYPNLGE